MLRGMGSLSSGLYWNGKSNNVNRQMRKRRLLLGLLPHHRDLLSLDGYVGPPEMAQSGDGGDAGGVHQVPVVVQHVDIHPDLPHLGEHTRFRGKQTSLCESHRFVGMTFSPDTTHRDSVSMHLEFLRHLSNCLFSFTDSSDCLDVAKQQKMSHTETIEAQNCKVMWSKTNLPCSKAGEARGDSSMLKNMIPSFGRLSFGATSSQDTWAMTLKTQSSDDWATSNAPRPVFPTKRTWGSPGLSQIHKAAAVVRPKADLDLSVVVGLPSVQTLHGKKDNVIVFP